MDKSSFSRGVLLKGLPFGTSKENIKEFFRNFAIPDENITLIIFRDMKQTGIAFVKLSDGEVQRALLMDRNHMGNRYIEVLASDEAEMYDLVLKAREGVMDIKELYRIAGKGSAKGGFQDRSPARRQFPTRCAYISGVPRGYTYRQVREFFKGRLIGHNCIHLLQCDDSNDFRGDGYIEFGNEVECYKGLQKNGDLLGGAVLHVVPCSKEEMEQIVQLNSNKSKGFRGKRDLRATIRKNQAAHLKKGHHTPRGRTPSPVRRRMKAYAATYRQQEDEKFSGYQSPYPTPGMNIPFGNPSAPHSHRRSDPVQEEFFKPEDYQHFWPPGEHRGNPFLDSGNEPGFEGHVARNPFPEHEFSTPFPHRTTHFADEHHPSIPVPDTRPSHHPPVANTSSHSPPKIVERRIVRLEGLPYEVNVRDIVEFFRGFQIEFEHVRIQCRDDGSPSGKAFVTFPSEKHAASALRSHNKQYILGRYVELILV